jgi:hypothetical protein
MPTMNLTPEEARHIVKRRRSERRDEFFQAGLEAAALEVLVWDGAIPDKNARHQIARAIRALKRPRNTKTKEG